MDFTLGDVVCATRVHDFSVRAVKEGAKDTYSAAGGPMHPEIQRLLASLPAILRQDLDGWNSPEAIGTPKPALRVPAANSDRYYGDVKWKADLRRTLLHHFPRGHPPRPPIVTSRQVATSDSLIKSTDPLSQWQEHARAVAAVEMELGGVFIAARQIEREHPILAIRGISDIVGFKREEQWTKYACATAAAFAYALVRAGAPFEPRIAEVNEWSHQPEEQPNSRPWRRVGSSQFAALVYALGVALPSVSQADDTAGRSGVSRHLIRQGRGNPIQRWQAVLEQAIDDGVDDALCSEALKQTNSAQLRTAVADWIGIR
jgi:nucleoside phosphorylase